ncbi:MAG: hypothetical protein R3E64_17625 [Halioglobus sp.]
MAVALDLLEILAVFLLAVEAIKLDNLSKLTNRLLVPTLDIINPKITFVEKIAYKGIFDRYWFEISLFSFYLLGLLISCFSMTYIGVDVLDWLRNTSGLSWLWIIPCVIFVPFIVGFLPYQGVVFAFQISVKGLYLVEKHTSTGVVGIMGFSLYLLQFIGRRLLAS